MDEHTIDSATRAEVRRALLVTLRRERREAEIAAAYRRAYATEADPPSVGEAGLHLGAALLAAEEAADPGS